MKKIRISVGVIAIILCFALMMSAVNIVAFSSSHKEFVAFADENTQSQFSVDSSFNNSRSDLINANGTSCKSIKLEYQGGKVGDADSGEIFARDFDTDSITIPQKDDYVFYGYFTEPEASGTQYYNYFGKRIEGISLNSNSPEVLYAAWVRVSNTIKLAKSNPIRIDEDNGEQQSPFKKFGLDIQKLKEVGYNKLTVALKISIRAQDKGEGRDMWFKVNTDGEESFSQRLLDNADIQYTDWKNNFATVEVELNKISNISEIGFKFKQSDHYFWTDAIWWFKEAYCYISASDRAILDPLTHTYKELKTQSYTLADNTGYNINGIAPNGNVLNREYAELRLQFVGGNIIEGDTVNGIKQYGYVYDNKYSETDSVELNLQLKYNDNSKTDIFGSGWEISEDSYCESINGISNVGVVQTGALLVQKLTDGGNPNNSKDWEWENPVTHGITQSFHTVDFVDNYSPNDYDGNHNWVKRVEPVIKRNEDGSYVFKYDENDPTRIVGYEYEKDADGNYVCQDTYKYSDGYTPIYTPKGSDLKKGVTLRIIFAYELKRKHGKSWEYKNIVEETLLSIYPSTGNILFQNLDLSSYDNDEEALKSETASSELVRTIGTVYDGCAVNDGFRLNFNGNKSYRVEYYKNNATNELDKKYAVDGQVFIEPGRYTFRVFPVVGSHLEKSDMNGKGYVETTIYINDKGTAQNLEKYFGSTIISNDSHRVYSQTDAIPVYLAEQTYWQIKQVDEYSMPLAGIISIAMPAQAERIDAFGKNYIIYNGETLYENIGYIKRDFDGEVAFFKILQYIEATDRKSKKAVLTETGTYYCEFANNPNYFKSPDELSGDFYRFVFQFRVTDEPQKPYINQQLLSNNVSFVDYNSHCYVVKLPVKGKTSINVAYAFVSEQDAYEFAYSYQRSLVKVNGSTYSYNNKIYNAPYEVIAEVEQVANSMISSHYFDATNIDSYLTTQSNVYCSIDSDGFATLQIREPIKDENDKITGYNVVNTVDLKQSVTVFSDAFSVDKYVIGEPLLNNKPYAYVDEYGVIKTGYNPIRFIQAAEYESKNITISKGNLSWEIEYGIPVQEFLENKNAPSGRYKITEKNLDAVNEYYAVYIAPGDNSTVLSITRINGKNSTTQSLTKANANIRFENINGLVINSAVNDLDPYGIVKIINTVTGETTIKQLAEIAGYIIDEQGHYEIHVVDRLANEIVFYADIYDATKFYSLTFKDGDSIVNTMTVGGGTRVSLNSRTSQNEAVEFAGWQDENGSVITDDYFYYDYFQNMSLSAVWHYKSVAIDLYDGEKLDSYTAKPGAFLQLEDLYGTTKDGLSYFRYVYEDGNGNKHFYLPEIQSVPNDQNIRLDTLWRDSTPIYAKRGDALSPLHKDGYIFYGYIYNNDTLLHDKVDLSVEGEISLYALYVTDSNYVDSRHGVVAGFTNFVNGIGNSIRSVVSSKQGIAGISIFGIFAIIALALIIIRKRRTTNNTDNVIVKSSISTAEASKTECVCTVARSVSYSYNRERKGSHRSKIHLPKFSYKNFGIPFICGLLVFVMSFVCNYDTIFTAKYSIDAYAETNKIERAIDEYNEERYDETLPGRNLYSELTTEQDNQSDDLQKDFLYSSIKLDLMCLGYEYAFNAELTNSNNERIKGIGYTYYDEYSDEDTDVYYAGFISYEECDTSLWNNDSVIIEYIDEIPQTEYEFSYASDYEEKITETQYIAFQNYVVYAVHDSFIDISINQFVGDGTLLFEQDNLFDKIKSLGFLYNYDSEMIMYDNFGQNISQYAISTLQGINYQLALDSLMSLLANQEQFGSGIDATTVVAIDVAALNEIILNGQDESLLGISSEQLYFIESQLSNASFYYVNGETGSIQTLDIQTVLDKYYAEAHKDDVTFLEVLNWVLNVGQIVVGFVLCFVPGMQFTGGWMLASGIIGTTGLILDKCGIEVSQLIAGINMVKNGGYTFALGISLLSKGPIGIVAGIVCIGVGAGQAFFGANDIIEYAWGDNLFKDVIGMSESAYQWTELGINVASTICTIAGSALNKSLSDKKLTKEYELDPRSIEEAKKGDPSWGTFRKRVWENEAKYNRKAYSDIQLKRMEKGLAPLVDGKSMHLHHVFGKSNDPYAVVKLTVSQHIQLHKAIGYHYNSEWNWQSIINFFKGR